MCYFYQIIPIPGGPLITEDAAGVFILVGILEAETSTKEISDKTSRNFNSDKVEVD